jgi:nucleotide-binding universal stress UspA family protein
LIGVAASEVMPPVYGGGALASAIINELRPQTESRLKVAADRFLAGAKGKAQEMEWRQALAKPAGFVAEQSRAADLIVTGAVRGRIYIDPFTELDPGDLIMQAGRPVLVVPPEAETLKAKHVLVAWKDTREARRAVLDALPLLQAATDVTVVEIADRAEIKSAERSDEDVAAWLKRHGVCAGAHAVVASESTFDALEAILQQNAADLIVAGAYGHSRTQEWIFGGLTRDLLTKARCCCLFAN